jgi:hypothetical protein
VFVSPGSAHAVRRQPVEVRRLHDLVAGAAEDVGALVVGDEQQDVRRPGDRRAPR